MALPTRKKPVKKLTRAQIVEVGRKATAKTSGKPVRASTTPGGEKGLQYRCKQWLDKSGLWTRLLIFHVANERQGSIGAAVHFKRMGVLPGVADWLAFPPGRAVAIELKDEGGDQDSGQEKFQERWEAAGNTYYLCRTEDEFRAVVTALAIFAS